MRPAPGDHLLRYVGDVLEVWLSAGPVGSRGFLRTNLGRAAVQRSEVVALAGAGGDERTFAGASWRDLPMHVENGAWVLRLPLLEPGAFRAKAYLRDAEGRQHWPEGDDLGLSVHPDALRTANAVYCAFPRLLAPAPHPVDTAAVQALQAAGYSVLPPSGTLRDLTRALPHIFDTLGCRILHLLPLGPVPTTFARMGTFGSPYAQLDLTQIDPALVAFDRRATAEDQFQELVDGVRSHGGRLLLDIVLNHTGWGARLMSERPDWYQRDAEGAIRSPGAWGTTWEDLAELDPQDPGLWETVAQSLLTWCRRGVDGFRCDAGYMVPLAVWEYVIARVGQTFPDTIFLLEGLGGAWEATADRLAHGMQWAYSELFQNHGPRDVSGYLDHAWRQGSRLGPLLHYSETHDNLRLAGRGVAWARLRNALCALASQSGAWGFTSGVEWLATEKIDVHGATDLRWGAEPNLLGELGDLNRLLADHPCFFDGARVERLSPADSQVLALLRTSADGLDHGLAVVNLDPDRPQALDLSADPRLHGLTQDLLGRGLPPWEATGSGPFRMVVPAGGYGFLTSEGPPRGLSGEAYRTLRAQAAWALEALAWVLPPEGLGTFDWRTLGARAAQDPGAFLGALRHLDAGQAVHDLGGALDQALLRAAKTYPTVVVWSAQDARRLTPVPPGHAVLLTDDEPFSLELAAAGTPARTLRSVPMAGGHVAALAPVDLPPGPATLRMDRHRSPGPPLLARLQVLEAVSRCPAPGLEGHALLTNGRGGYARLHADLSRIESKYDALLAANLDPQRPTERHVLAKRVRAWAIVDGFLTSLDLAGLVAFEPGPPARWTWAAHGGDGRCAALELRAWMAPGANQVLLAFTRLAQPPAKGRPLPAEAEVRLTVRLDLEDRSHHGETDASEGATAHFQGHTRPLDDHPGFAFTPAPDRTLRAWASGGAYHPEPEWCRGLPHPHEASRGQRAQGDAWSPGWFELNLPEGATVNLTLSAEPGAVPLPAAPEPRPAPATLEGALRAALPAYLARRDGEATVLAGYPWFLDWGRDALIACRGLLAGGYTDEALSVLRAFGALERQGTLPNALFGADHANRESSDAPLWFALACEAALDALGPACLDADCGGRSLRRVIADLARGYLAGTPTGVRVDPTSGLVWSPAHFTWMDTNHPAGSPREGFPIELQALWIRQLRLLERLGEPPDREPWALLAARAEAHLERYWHEELGFAADTLHGAWEGGAQQAQPDDHLRPNQLWLVALGLWRGARAQRLVQACGRHLLLPGALRSLAPLPVRHPLPIPAPWGGLLGDPHAPYWGRYEGDEDTRRKPAYHNGTAWVWLLPLYAEALAAAWPGDAAALAAARAVLGSLAPLLGEDCLGQLPELLDGDAPHAPRGCAAQAWSVTEALRVSVTLGGLG